MTGDPSGPARRERRAVEEVKGALRRGDFARATSAYVALPAPLRAPFTGVLGAHFRADVSSAHRGSRWRALEALAQQADAAPELVSSGVRKDDEREVWWTLLWGAGRQDDWATAGRIWARIEVWVREQAPSLGRAIESWVSSCGAPDEASIAALDLPSPPTDPRLGVEPVRPRRAPPLPSSPDEAAGAVARLHALGHRDFALGVKSWLSRAEAGTARQIATTAAKLSARDIFRRLSSHEPRPFEALPLFLDLVEHHPAPELESDVMRVFKVVVKAGSTDAPHAPPFSSFSRAVLALAAYPQHRELINETMGALTLPPSTAPSALALLETLLELRPSPRLWSRAVFLWLDSAREGSPLPDRPLLETLRRLIESSPGFLDWLRTRKPKARRLLLEFIGAQAPLHECEQTLSALAPGADEALREDLGSLLAALSERAAPAAPVKLGDAISQLGLPMSARERKQLEGMADLDLPPALRAMLGLSSEDAEVDPAIMAIVGRFAPGVLQESPQLLGSLLATASPAEARGYVASYIGPSASVERWIDAVQTLVLTGKGDLANDTVEEALRRFGEDLPSLSKLMLWCSSIGAPPEVQRLVADTLLRAHDLRCTGEHTPELDRALSIASVNLSARRARPSRPRKPPTTRKPAQKKSPASKAKPAEPSTKPAGRARAAAAEDAGATKPRPRGRPKKAKPAGEGGGQS